MKNENKKTAILLINIGSPKNTSSKEIKKFLKYFLMDPYIIDVPWIFRWILVNKIIIPKRISKVTESYESIWQKEKQDFPLNTITQSFIRKLQKVNKNKYYYAMRYSSPYIFETMNKIKQDGYKKIFIIPLYPQYCKATSFSGIQECHKINKKYFNNFFNLNALNHFYQCEEFIESWIININNFIQKLSLSTNQFKDFYFLFSFHGLPLHQLKNECKKIHISSQNKENQYNNFSCCESIENNTNDLCYRAHCIQTAKKIAEKIPSLKNKYFIAFQSRLGKSKWIEPYTEDILKDLPKKGIKKLIVICPSFVCDCIETLVEIEQEGSSIFKKHGGEKLILLPSLNDNSEWINNFDILCSKHESS